MSTLKVGALKNADGTRTKYTASAWVNFNGTGTVAIRDSGNVSSITDNGTGDYTVNFSTTLVDANYSMVATASRYMTVNADGIAWSGTNQTTSLFRLNTFASGYGISDGDYVCAIVFGGDA